MLLPSVEHIVNYIEPGKQHFVGSLASQVRSFSNMNEYNFNILAFKDKFPIPFKCTLIYIDSFLFI